MRINLASTFTLIVSGALFIGCGDDGGVTTTGATASGSTGENTSTGTTTTGTPTTSTSTTNDTTGSPTTTTTGPDSTSTTEPETSTTTTTGPDTSSGGVDTTGEPGSTGGTTGGDDVCAPDPMDDACVMCTKSDCCDELKSCMMEEACACFVECAQTNPNPIVCLGQCPGVDLMHPFIACAQGCGCGG